MQQNLKFEILQKVLLLNLEKANTFNTYRTSGHSSVVERLVANEKVVGSSPIARSKKL